MVVVGNRREIDNLPHILDCPQHNFQTLIKVPGRDPMCLKCRKLGHLRSQCTEGKRQPPPSLRQRDPKNPWSFNQRKSDDEVPSNCSDSESEGNVTVVGISPTVSVNEVRDAVPGPSKASADAHVSNADAHVSNDEVKVSNDDDAHKDDTPDDSTSEVNSQSSSSVTNSQVSTNKVDIQGSKPSDSTSSDNVKDGELNENIESDSNNGDNEYEDVDDDDDDEKDFISPTQPGYHKSSLVRKRKSKRIVKSSKK